MVNNILNELQEGNKSLLEGVEMLKKQLAEKEQTIKQLEENPVVRSVRNIIFPKSTKFLIPFYFILYCIYFYILYL